MIASAAARQRAADDHQADARGMLATNIGTETE